MGPIGVGWSPSFSGRQGGSRTPTRAPCGGAGPVGGAGRAGSSLGAEVPAFDVGLAPPCGASGGGREGGATPPRYYLGRRGARREPRPERTRGGGFRPESAARQPCCDRRRAAVGIPGLGHFPGFPGPWASPSPTRSPGVGPGRGGRGVGGASAGSCCFCPEHGGRGARSRLRHQSWPLPRVLLGRLPHRRRKIPLREVFVPERRG